MWVFCSHWGFYRWCLTLIDLGKCLWEKGWFVISFPFLGAALHERYVTFLVSIDVFDRSSYFIILFSTSRCSVLAKMKREYTYVFFVVRTIHHLYEVSYYLQCSLFSSLSLTLPRFLSLIPSWPLCHFHFTSTYVNSIIHYYFY